MECTLQIKNKQCIIFFISRLTQTLGWRSERCWEPMKPLMYSIDMNAFDLQKLPIEIETSTGIQTLTLEYSDNDNPYEAAQAFIDKHQVRFDVLSDVQLQQDYLDEIAQYIMKNRGNSNMTIGSSQSKQTSSSSSSSSSSFTSTSI